MSALNKGDKMFFAKVLGGFGIAGGLIAQTSLTSGFNVVAFLGYGALTALGAAGGAYLGGKAHALCAPKHNDGGFGGIFTTAAMVAVGGLSGAVGGYQLADVVLADMQDQTAVATAAQTADVHQNDAYAYDAARNVLTLRG